MGTTENIKEGNEELREVCVLHFLNLSCYLKCHHTINIMKCLSTGVIFKSYLIVFPSSNIVKQVK